jgi:hypothetical protein
VRLPPAAELITVIEAKITRERRIEFALLVGFLRRLHSHATLAVARRLLPFRRDRHRLYYVHCVPTQPTENASFVGLFRHVFRRRAGIEKMKKLPPPRMTWRGGELEIDHKHFCRCRFPARAHIVTGLKRAPKVFASSHGEVVGIKNSGVINYFCCSRLFT